MSPDRYPLIVFGDANSGSEHGHGGQRIDPPSDSRDFPGDVDSISRAIQREKMFKKLCQNGSKDKRCLTGVRPLESSRLSRLIDGPASVPYPPYMNNPREEFGDGHPNYSLPGSGNTSIFPSVPKERQPDSPNSSALSAQALATYVTGLVTLVMLLVWMYHKRERKPFGPTYQIPVPTATTVAPVEEHQRQDSPVTESVASTDDILVEKLILESPLESKTLQEVEMPRATPKSVSFGNVVKAGAIPDVEGDDIGDIGGDADDSEGDTVPVPGRRKPARRKRGKKKKSGLANSGAEEGAIDGKDTKLEQDELGEGPQIPKANDYPEPIHVVSPSSLVVPPPPNPVPVEPSLVVSDTVLGKLDVRFTTVETLTCL
jgi:serine/threonine-protein kinase/endoribonuclease IRE1